MAEMKFQEKKLGGRILREEIRSRTLRNLLKMCDRERERERERERSRRVKVVMRRLAKVKRCPAAAKSVT